MATSTTPDKPLLLTFRAEDSAHGVTRATVQRMAQIKGLSETALIHLALANLARTTLPRYEPDDGPLTEAQLAAIREDASKYTPKGPLLSVRTLFTTPEDLEAKLMAKVRDLDTLKAGLMAHIPMTIIMERFVDLAEAAAWFEAKGVTLINDNDQVAKITKTKRLK